MRSSAGAALLLAVLPLLCDRAAAQTSPEQVKRILEAPLASPDLVAYQLRSYLLRKAPKPPQAASAEAWLAQARTVRRDVLDKIVFHGWPQEWVTAAPRFEPVGEPVTGSGYRLRRLRYEIVPGMTGTAVLYEPLQLSGKVPAILNVNGHVGAQGKAIEYKQKRCINQALQGMLSLNLEWLSYGELDHKENQHWFGAHLDLVGSNGVGLFYLAMRRGLDYLASHPNADQARLGVTGLSGGGWQTIMLSALDERVAVSVPVAGYGSVVSRIERAGDVGDIEQNPTDLLTIADYPHLTALRAPRPTLLAYNAEDDCCFRAALVKPHVYDQIRPFYELYKAGDRFAWHENTDPGDHNYQLDNRLASYRFFARHFRLPDVPGEADVGAEVKSREELAAGLPSDNLTILSLARRLAAQNRRAAASGPEDLRRLVRYQPVRVEHAWALASSHHKGLTSQSYRFDFSNGLSATGVWLAASHASSPRSPVTVVLHDAGRTAAHVEISERLNRGEQVLALNLLFTGDAAPQRPDAASYSQLLATLGDRPLGLIAAQLNAVASWAARRGARSGVRLSSTGRRNQVAALVAASIEPAQFEEIEVREGMASLQELLDKPVEYAAAPELFCLDLYRDFDLPRLAELSRGSRPGAGTTAASPAAAR